MNEIKRDVTHAVTILEKYNNSKKKDNEPLPTEVINALNQIASLFGKHRENLQHSLLQRMVSAISKYADDSPIRKSSKNANEIFAKQEFSIVGDLRKEMNKELRKVEALSIKCNKSIQDDRLEAEVLVGKTTEEHKQYLEKELGLLFQERQVRLEDISGVYEKIDFQNSQFMDSYTVCQKNFPKTYAWVVGSVAQPEEQDKTIEKQMVEVGNKYGIRVISDPPIDRETGGGLVILGTNNLMVYKQENFWQDCLEFTSSSVRLPRTRKKGESTSFVKEIIMESRSDKEEEFDARGQVFTKNASKKALYLAKAIEVPVLMNLTHAEGGNVLLGKNKAGPYLIVGKDSYTTSKRLMEIDLKRCDKKGKKYSGKELTEEEVKMAFGIDYGVPKERIYIIDQPGDFHLDMSLMLTDDGILLSNSKQAWEEFNDHPNRKEFLSILANEYWVELAESGQAEGKNKEEEIAKFIQDQEGKLEADVNMRSEFEEKVFLSLKDDFDVIRVPGRFHYTKENQAMNFFNSVTAENAQGKKIVIAGECIDETYKAKFCDIIMKHTRVQKNHIEFISLKTAQQLLGGKGSVQCNTKTIPLT